jgi:hypothetical protein
VFIRDSDDKFAATVSLRHGSSICCRSFGERQNDIHKRPKFVRI